MTTESIRERFEAWHLKQLELGGGFFYEKETGFEAWKAATLAERERCAKVCELKALEGITAKEANREDIRQIVCGTVCAEAIRRGE